MSRVGPISDPARFGDGLYCWDAGTTSIATAGSPAIIPNVTMNACPGQLVPHPVSSTAGNVMQGIDIATAEIIFHGLLNKSGPPIIIVRDKWGEHTRTEEGGDPHHVPWGEEDAGLPPWAGELKDVSHLLAEKPATPPPEPPRAHVARRSIQRIANAFESLWGQPAKPPAPTPGPARRRIGT